QPDAALVGCDRSGAAVSHRDARSATPACSGRFTAHAGAAGGGAAVARDLRVERPARGAGVSGAHPRGLLDRTRAERNVQLALPARSALRELLRLAPRAR